jgi:choline transport protein
MRYPTKLNRELTSRMLCSISFNVISSFVCINISMGTLLSVGGPAMMIYGWIIGTIFNGIIIHILADMSKEHQVAGGVYTWSGIYSSYNWCSFISYISGWFNYLGLIASIAFFA